MNEKSFAAAQRRWDKMEDEDDRKFCLFCDEQIKEEVCENTVVKGKK